VTAQSQEWERTERHPELPGGDLGSFEMDGGTCLYDRDNPAAFIVGKTVEIGTER
jgi:hypothetical protein